jgi:transglutaminase-like putative cysteine protease
MKIAIEHCTAWRTADGGGISTQLLRLTPRDSARQRVLSWDLARTISARAMQSREQHGPVLPGHASRCTDPFGNVQHLLTVDGNEQDITLTARGVVEINTQAEEGDDGLNPLLFLRSTALTRADDAISDFADNFRVENPTRDVLRALMIAIGSRLPASGGAFGGCTAAQAFAGQAGTCHDQSHVFLACARLLGVPARCVSGYVHGGDRIASHAWAEAFVHGRWQTFDVANRLDRATTHLKLAIGMDYLDACPVRGARVACTREQLSGQALIEQAQRANQ